MAKLLEGYHSAMILEAQWRLVGLQFIIQKLPLQLYMKRSANFPCFVTSVSSLGWCLGGHRYLVLRLRSASKPTKRLHLAATLKGNRGILQE